MKHTVARFAVVAIIAALVGVFVALVVYVTLVAGVIFLLAAAAVGLVMRRRRRLPAPITVEPAPPRREIERP